MDDAIEETTAPGLPDPPGSNDTLLYIPEFVTKHVHDDIMTEAEEQMLAAHALFLLKKDFSQA
jgi:hypothetical protein